MLENFGAEHLSKIVNAIRNTLVGNENRDEIYDIVTTTLAGGGFSLELTDQVIEQLNGQNINASNSEQPILIAVFGSEFHVGHNVRIDFHIKLPQDTTGNLKPTSITATQSSTLDQSSWEKNPPIKRESKNHWTFHEEFALRETNKSSCPAGSYGIDLEIDFNAPVNSELKMHLRASMKIRVPDPNSHSNRKLEIDTDDDSLISMMGTDLSIYGTVSIKGRGKSLQNILSTPSDINGENHPPNNLLQVIIPLKHNHERSEKLPYVSTVFNTNHQEKSKCLCLEYSNGHRTIVLDKIPLTFGRDRPADNGNDVALRWIPVESTNRDLTLKMSRQHFKLSPDYRGLVVTDLNSSFGTVVNESSLTSGESKVLKQEDSGCSHRIRLPGNFEIEVKLLPLIEELGGNSVDQMSDYPNAVGVHHQPVSWQIAKNLNLNAVCINRLTNLREENYVMLLRSALVGSSSDCAIKLFQYEGFPHVARIIAIEGRFYLNRLVSKNYYEITIDDYEPDNELELVPLQIGQVIRFGSSVVKIVDPQQNLSQIS